MLIQHMLGAPSTELLGGWVWLEENKFGRKDATHLKIRVYVSLCRKDRLQAEYVWEKFGYRDTLHLMLIRQSAGVWAFC